MTDSNEINLAAGAQAHQDAAGSNISQTYIAQQIVNAPAPSQEFASPFRLKVFISSTQTDLQSERDAAQAVIESLGHECWRAETFHAPGWSPESVCKYMARNCDIYIGIYGSRYGTIDERIGTSITEMEFEEAKNIDPTKMLIYVKESLEREARQSEFLAKVQDFHSGYFRHAHFSSHEKMAEQIHNDLISWAAAQIVAHRELERELLALRSKMEHLQAHYKQIAEVYGLKKEILL